jgi:hypothetical protein
MQIGSSASPGAQTTNQGQRALNNGRGNLAKNVKPMGPNKKTDRFGIHRRAPTGQGRSRQIDA